MPWVLIGSAGHAAHQSLKLIAQLHAANILCLWNPLHDVEAATGKVVCMSTRDKEGYGIPLLLVEAWHGNQAVDAIVAEEHAPSVVRDYHPAT